MPPVALWRSTTAVWQTPDWPSASTRPDETFNRFSSARVGAWFSMTPMTRAVTSFAPLGAAMAKSAAVRSRFMLTVFLALAG